MAHFLYLHIDAKKFKYSDLKGAVLSHNKLIKYYRRLTGRALIFSC